MSEMKSNNQNISLTEEDRSLKEHHLHKRWMEYLVEEAEDKTNLVHVATNTTPQGLFVSVAARGDT